MGRTRWAWAATLGLLAAAGAGVVGAQEVEGVVRDADGRRLAEAQVLLRDRDANLVAEARTADDGEFSLRAPAPGEYFLRVTRPAYQPLDGGPYRLQPGQPLEVLVVMHPDPIPVDSLTASVARRVLRLDAVGFYDRRDAGFGWFLERDAFEAGGVHRVVDALERVPGVVVGRAQLLAPQLLLAGGPGRCSPTVIIDGTVVHRGGAGSGPVRPDEWLAPHDVEAAEVYVGPATAPIQYQNMASCGVVLFWTRHAPPLR